MHHVRTFILPKDIGNAIEPDRPRETPDQAKAIQFLAQHDRIDELMQDFLEEVEGSFYLVKRDIDAYVARMEVGLRRPTAHPYVNRFPYLTTPTMAARGGL